MIKVSTTGMVVSLKTDLRFPLPGQQGHGGRIIQTAKANNLRVYEYLEYLLTELPKHADDTSRDFLKDLLPWSEKVQKKCRSLKKSE